MTTPPLYMSAAPARRFDLDFLKRACFYVAVALLIVAPMSPDPLAFGAGALVPWIIMQIVVRPGVPISVAYLFLYQWLQIFARALQSVIDGEAIGAGVYGPNVARAYWYMLASLIVMAIGLRLALGTPKPATPQDRAAHLEWRPMDLFVMYIAMLFVAVACRFLSGMIPALEQPIDAFGRLKIVILFMLFCSVMMSGRGGNLMMAAFGFELVMGFGGLLSDFRGIFIYLAMAALASRVAVKGTTVAMGIVGFAFLLYLALFWTSVKAEYREYATGSSDSQNLKISIDDRFGYLGSRFANSADIDWSQSAYAFVNRLAYVDIFGSVIGVQETSPEAAIMRQWTDAIEHVTKPRFLFPGKAALSDTEVYIRLARGDASEQLRLGTSISVGYIAENFVDLGFPGMLGGMFVIGLLCGLVVRYCTSMKIPWVLREGVVLAFVYGIAQNGVEMSLPKLLGALVMFCLVYGLLNRFAFPVGLNWLKERSDIRQPQLS